MVEMSTVSSVAFSSLPMGLSLYMSLDSLEKSKFIIFLQFLFIIVFLYCGGLLPSHSFIGMSIAIVKGETKGHHIKSTILKRQRTIMFH